jgi:hypothetical protein
MSSIDMTVWKPISNQHALLIGFHTAADVIDSNPIELLICGHPMLLIVRTSCAGSFID